MRLNLAQLPNTIQYSRVTTIKTSRVAILKILRQTQSKGVFHALSDIGTVVSV